nr:MAG TPA: hypothetical protein [Caudoviricetes sp.]DAX57182.1 MAG TPA: hypothetical protein [Crassvirales sp.]
MNSLKCHCLASSGGTVTINKTIYLYLHYNNNGDKR